MSRAEPMTTHRRLAIYRRQNGADRLTVAQERQVRKQDKKLDAHRRRKKRAAARRRRTASTQGAPE